MNTKERAMKQIIPILIFLAAVPTLTAITPEEIIRTMEANQISESAYAEGRMITTDKYGTIIRSFNSWSRGEKKP